MAESKSEMTPRDTHVYAAKLAEQAERYDDMVLEMKAVAQLKVDLTVEERNLLSVAYKNVIGARRASWRVLSTISHKEETKKAGGEKAVTVAEYQKKVESELDTTCDEILQIIKTDLLESAVGTEATVFYHKMSGDYHRYLAEFKKGEEHNSAATEARDAYQQARDEAECTDEGKGLAPTHPIRLGLALNFSVFYYEILAKPEKACELAKSAFDDAIAELDSLQEDSYKDATLIMQLLRDNLTLWTSDEEQ